MSETAWTEVDRYFERTLLGDDPVLSEVIRESEAAGLPPIQVTPSQGRFLGLLVRAMGARRVLELGTLGAYSAICLARGLPAEGRLTTLEVNPVHADVARRNVARAGLSEKIEVRLGPAIDTLPRLLEEGAGPFDLSFLDADKSPSADYFDWALRLSRPGSVIVVDNVVRQGGVLDTSDSTPSVQGIRRLIDRVSAEPRVRATALQTVGGKGYDGFLFAVVDR